MRKLIGTGLLELPVLDKMTHYDVFHYHNVANGRTIIQTYLFISTYEEVDSTIKLFLS